MSAIVFWQVVNQSANVAFNYCNANKSTKMNNSELACNMKFILDELQVAYFTAVLSSSSIALGMSKLTRNVNASPFVKTLLSRSVPFTAVAMAGTINVFLMRQKEITQIITIKFLTNRDGIRVEDVYGNYIGNSSNAGLKAITQVSNE